MSTLQTETLSRAYRSGGINRKWSIPVILKSCLLILLCFHCVGNAHGSFSSNSVRSENQRSFRINYEKNTFEKDGQPFRYISGSFHYFRTVEQKWDDILRKFRLAGLNAVQTYVEWSSHQPTPQQNFSFDGNLNLFKFLDLAQQNNLSVILRPGPYICAERDLGGLPPWLLWQTPKMKLRTTQPDFIYYVSNWFGILLTMIKPYLYKNGGPIIMLQVENEYGNFGCDSEYKMVLRDLMQFHLGDDVVLFTTDNAQEVRLACGAIPGVLPTVDFGPEQVTELIDLHFATQRVVSPRGPLVNSEFYLGWMDHWKRKHSRKSTDVIAASLNRILKLGANVNFYMFYGGTSFGLTAGGSAVESHGGYDSCPTSYDYDAPLDESGDPTEKYFTIKSVISQYTPVPNENPGVSHKGNYGSVALKPLASIFDRVVLQMLDPEPVVKLFPVRFEDLGVGTGFVLYETLITVVTTDPIMLTVKDLKDRAYIFANEDFQGVLDRSEKIFSRPITVQKGQKLRILVENQGRMNFGPEISDLKGIDPEVKLGKYILDTWTMYRLRDFNGESLSRLLSIINYGPVLLPPTESDNEIYSREIEPIFSNFNLSNVKPHRAGMLYTGIFFAVNSSERKSKSESKSSYPDDTFLRLDGWTKGLVWVNGFLLGRYWPNVGPQVSLYVPGPILNFPPMENNIIVLELESAPYDCAQDRSSCSSWKHGKAVKEESNCVVNLVDTHVIDGPTPYN